MKPKNKITKEDQIKAELNGFHNGLKELGRFKTGSHKNKQKDYLLNKKRKHKKSYNENL